MRGCAQLFLVVGVGLVGAGVIPAKELVGIAETPFSPDNPFFDHVVGKPYFEALPNGLFQALGAAHCKWAWKRQQHLTSELDTSCTEILRPWIEATPGGLLGALDAITITEGFLVNPHPYALLTKPDMLSWTGPRSADVNLTKVGWQEAVPAIFAPQPLQSEPELHDDMIQGGKAPEAYVAHGFAAWAFKLAGGSATASDEAVFRAFKHTVELYTWMGHHAKQHDDSHRIYTDHWAGKTLIHGSHGAAYAYYSIQMDRKYPSPSTDVEGMWADLKAVCGPAGEVDYALYISCAHGLGHALSFYVSSYRASAAEAVQVCAHAAPDGRVAASCGDGFFHEFERANLWYDDALGQNFMPWGVRAPCDDVALQPFIYGCMYHVFIPSTSERSPVGAAWVETFEKDGLRMAKLNAEGARQWRALAGFCGKENYASSQQQASCAATFVSYFYTNLHAASVGASWLAESLLLEPCLRRAGKADGLPHPRLAVSQSASGMPYYPGKSLKLALCEAITDSYWSWMICALDGVAVNLEFVHSDPYSTVPSSHKRDAYAYAYGEGEQLGGWEAMTAEQLCIDMWVDERFEAGTEKQVAFMRNACIESIFSHGYTDWPLYDWSSLPSLYATFNSTTASTLASKVAAGNHDAAKAVASHSKNMASVDAIANSTAARPILLIHVEKTGGTSIIETLGIESAEGNEAERPTAECKGIAVMKSLHLRHQTAAQAQPYYTEEQWATAYKIAFVRNPWDRLVSLWSCEPNLILTLTHGTVWCIFGHVSLS